MAKKLAKENKKKVEMGWDQQHMNYSNVDNPFNDAKLTETFLWEKKLEKEGLKDVSPAEVEKINKERIQKNKVELDKAYQRRLERDAQKEEAEQMRRQNEAEDFRTWEKMEDDFHLQQARLRSKIRIRERRAKAIDLLAQYIHAEDEEHRPPGDEEPSTSADLDILMHEPYHYLNGLGIRDLEDLLADVRVYQSLGKIEQNDEYWRDLTTIAEEELAKLRKLQREGVEDDSGRRREGIHGSVLKEVSGIFKGKSHAELALLETEIKKKIKGQEEGVDVSYWETLLGPLKAHMARARLRDRHQEALKRRLKKLKEEQGVKEEPTAEEETVLSSTKKEEEELPPLTWQSLTPEERSMRMMMAYESGRYSPTYMKEEEVPPGNEILDPRENQTRLGFNRRELRESGVSTSQKDARLEAEAKRGMNDEERRFSNEVPLEQQSYLWSDKYRPRKPRYFNRVHTGFEWNKYNQTHYDLDNPPPKIVQGYKFNIFYPDLLDPTKPPEFTVIPCDDPDFAVLKFAGDHHMRT